MCVSEWLSTPIDKRLLTWENVRNISIDEADSRGSERLVEIIESSRLKAYSAYYHDHISGALKSVYTRESILRKLHELLQHLPREIGILVLDAWRPIEVQEALRSNFRENLVAEYPECSDTQIEAILNQFVAKPSQDPLAPSPHLTGGSIDLTLFDLGTNSELDMGTSFDAMEEASWSHYYEENAGTLEAEQIRENRRLLINGMKSVGFSNLPSEWWHFDYGNQLWGYYTDQNAFYGIANKNNY